MAKKRTTHKLRGVRIHSSHKGQPRSVIVMPLRWSYIHSHLLLTGPHVPETFDNLMEHEKLHMLSKLGIRHTPCYS